MAQTMGCVSFLNARPLIDGLDGDPRLRVFYDVPSALLEDLLTRQVSLALCPVIDYQLADEPLEIVPVGGIGCDGPTMTVRLYSRVPIAELRRVRIDPHSHSSIVLMGVLLHDVYGVRPELVTPGETGYSEVEAMLLIGDKVVNAAPDDDEYPYQLDLGEAWKQLTGLPFVFAVWMCRRDADLGDAAELLDQQRQINSRRIEQIAAACAPNAGWPLDLAQRYLGEYLRYGIGPRELQAMERFWQRAHELGLIERLRPLVLHGEGVEPVI